MGSPFDLRKFEKIDEDEDTATLKHPKGHTIVIAIKALPKIQREAIKRLKLSHGGKVEKNSGISEQGRDVRFAKNKVGQEKEMAKDFAKEEARGRAKFEREAIKPKMKGLAHGGEVKYKNQELAEKGRESIKRKHHMSPEQHKKNDQFWSDAERELKNNGPGSYKKIYAQGGEVQNYADDPDMVESPSDSAPQDMSSPQSSGQPITINVGSPQPQPIAQPIIAAEPKVSFPSPPPDVAQQAQAKPQQKSDMLNPDETANVAEAVRLQQTAAEQQVPISSEVSKQQVRNLDTALSERGREAERDQANIQDLARHTNDFKQYMVDNNWGIKENKYLDEMGSGKKTSLAIGLFFGGLGTPFGGTNVAYDFLNKQIDRNIAAQKERSDNQKTVWGAYNTLYGNENIANNLAKVSTRDMMVQRAEMIAAQQGTPQAIQKLNELKAKVLIDNQKNLFDAAKIRGALSPVKGRGAPSVKENKNISPGQASAEPSHRKPTDPEWADLSFQPGTSRVPKTNPIPQIVINYDKLKKSQMLGAEGVPNSLTPAELGSVNDAANMANSKNQAIKEIHKQYEEMWKNADDSQDATKYIADQGLMGLHLPDMRSWSPKSKRYFTAASAVVKQIGNAMKGGGSEELYRMIGDQLIKANDKSYDYRQKLDNLDNVIRQDMPTAILRKYNLATGLPGEE